MVDVVEAYVRSNVGAILALPVVQQRYYVVVLQDCNTSLYLRVNERLAC